jgi:DNA-binding transcriptional LysR family regulator
MHNHPVIDCDDLRHLLAVAREGSTAAAARALGVNQSTVVRRVAALEEGLGLRLFDKRRDGYRPTAEGVALVGEAGAVEASVLAFLRRAASLDGALAGSLRVTTAEGIAARLMPALLGEFHRRYPEMRVNLLIEDRYRELGDGQADVAIRAGGPGDDTLVGRKLGDLAWAVYGSRGYVERHGRPAAPADLDGHHLVGFEGALERIAAARWLREVAPRGLVACRSNSILGHLMAAQLGVGLALLPCHIGDAEAELVRVVEPPPALTAGLWVLTHPDLCRSPRVRAFLDFMAVEIERYRPLLLGRVRPGGP